jgi:hypothetical protein
MLRTVSRLRFNLRGTAAAIARSLPRWRRASSLTSRSRLTTSERRASRACWAFSVFFRRTLRPRAASTLGAVRVQAGERSTLIAWAARFLSRAAVLRGHGAGVFPSKIATICTGSSVEIGSARSVSSTRANDSLTSSYSRRRTLLRRWSWCAALCEPCAKPSVNGGDCSPLPSTAG